MLFRILDRIDRIVPFPTASAHCDVPCGIYDPVIAQIAALTVIRMADLMDDMEKKSPQKDVNYINSMTRYIQVKEEHSEKCKHEVRVLLGDYFNPSHRERFPELDHLGIQIYKLASESRQTADRNKGVELLKRINRLTEIFWEVRGVQTKRVKAPYKPEEEIVVPVHA